MRRINAIPRIRGIHVVSAHEASILDSRSPSRGLLVAARLRVQGRLRSALRAANNYHWSLDQVRSLRRAVPAKRLRGFSGLPRAGWWRCRKFHSQCSPCKMRHCHRSPRAPKADPRRARHRTPREYHRRKRGSVQWALTIHSTRRRFAAQLNSGVSPQNEMTVFRNKYALVFAALVAAAWVLPR